MPPRSLRRLVLAVLALPVGCAVLVPLALHVSGCAAVKPACLVIDLANTTCSLVTVKLEDGTTVEVPKESVRLAAKQALAAKQSSPAASSSAKAPTP